MANIKSSEKRISITRRRTAENRPLKTKLQSALKKFNAAINSNDVALAEKLLPETVSIIDGMATKGIIHKKNASNKIAHISRVLNDLKTGKITIVVEQKRVFKSKAAPVKEEPKVEAPVKEEKKAAKEKAKKEEKPAKKAKAAAPKAEKKKEKVEVDEVE